MQNSVEQAAVKLTEVVSTGHHSTFVRLLYLLKTPLCKVITFMSIWMPLLLTRKPRRQS
jgi:hypothetical protein